MLTTIAGWFTSQVLGGIAVLIGVLGVSVWTSVNELRAHAKAVAMNEIPKVEEANPDADGQAKMDMVLATIWARLGIPMIFIPAMDFVFGRIVEDAAQWVFDEYFAAQFSKPMPTPPPTPEPMP